MGRSSLLLLVGAFAGAALTYGLSAGSPSAASRADAGPDVSAPVSPDSPRPVPQADTAVQSREAAAPLADATARGRALAQELMAQTDGAVLEAMVREAASSSNAGAGATMELLLARYGELEPLAAMDLALELSAQARVVVPIYRSLMRTDPQLALSNVDAWAARLSSDVATPFGPPGRAALLHAGLQELAAWDPAQAAAYVEEMPDGPERQTLLSTVARGYGRSDPEAALAWVQGGYPPDSGLLHGVLAGIAEVDALRALDAALTLIPPMQHAPALQMVVMQGVMQGPPGQNPAIAEQLGHRLLESGTAARGVLVPFVSAWAGRDPQAALGWLLANGASVDASVYRSAAEAAARLDPDAVAAHLHQVPQAVRSEWIAAAARGYAAYDPQQALHWLESHRGDPGYPQALAGVATSLATRDPVAAAQLLEGLDDRAAMGAIFSVASQWARLDPPAAASWALRRGEQQPGSPALTSVIQSWVNSDLDGARWWALGLPRSAQRDQALTAVISSMAALEPPDAQLLAAFADDRARQRAVFASVPRLMQRDPDAARALLDRYVTDPELRRQAERWVQDGSAIDMFFRPDAIAPGVNSFGRPVTGSEPVSGERIESQR